MDNFQIETAQNVTIKHNVATLPERILAHLIDVLVIIGYAVCVFIIMAIIDANVFDNWAFYLIFSLPILFYSLFMETFNNGQSLGKKALKIRVVKLDGSKSSFGGYLIRWIIRPIEISICYGAVAMITIIINGKGQRLGDLAAGTSVITEKKQVTIENTLLVEVEENYQPMFPQVMKLSDKDIQTIKTLLQQARYDKNYKVVEALHKKIIEITDIKSDMRPLAVVETVIKDYNYYTQQG